MADYGRRWGDRSSRESQMAETSLWGRIQLGAKALAMPLNRLILPYSTCCRNCLHKCSRCPCQCALRQHDLFASCRNVVQACCRRLNSRTHHTHILDNSIGTSNYRTCYRKVCSSSRGARRYSVSPDGGPSHWVAVAAAGCTASGHLRQEHMGCMKAVVGTGLADEQCDLRMLPCWVCCTVRPLSSAHARV